MAAGKDDGKLKVSTIKSEILRVVSVMRIKIRYTSAIMFSRKLCCKRNHEPVLKKSFVKDIKQPLDSRKSLQKVT